MIRIALVEDDPAYAEQLLSYLKEYEKESKERISVQTFSDGEDIVTEYRADYDIILYIKRFFQQCKAFSCDPEIFRMYFKTAHSFVSHSKCSAHMNNCRQFRNITVSCSGIMFQ